MNELTARSWLRQLPLVSRLPVRAKMSGFRALASAQRVIARTLRAVPGSWRWLGLPSRRIRSLKDEIAEQRSDLDWIQKSKGVYCETLFEATAVSRLPPVALDGQPHDRAFSLERYHVHNEVYLARIPHGRVLGPNGTVITPEGGIVEESTWGAGWLERDRALMAINLPQPERLSGSYFTVASAFSEGFAHWVLDVLPRFVALEKLPVDEVRILVAQPLNSWQRDSLEMLGVDLTQVVVLGDRYVETEALYFPSYVGDPGNPHPSVSIWLRDKLLRNCPAGDKRRIYITRRRAPKRRVVNEEELEPILSEYGFEIVASEDLLFRDEVSLFSGAQAIVSSHGAGLTNALFAPPGCKILEFFDPRDVKANNYALANVLGHKYWYFIGQEVMDTTARHHTTGHDDVYVPAGQFSRALAAITEAS